MKINMKFGEQKRKNFYKQINNSRLAKDTDSELYKQKIDQYNQQNTISNRTPHNYHQLIHSLIREAIESTKMKIGYIVPAENEIKKLKNQIYTINLAIIDIEYNEEKQKKYDEDIETIKRREISTELQKVHYDLHPTTNILDRLLFIKIKPHTGENFTEQPSTFEIDLNDYQEERDFYRKKIATLQKEIKEKMNLLIMNSIKNGSLTRIKNLCSRCHNNFNVYNFHYAIIIMLIEKINIDEIIDIITKYHYFCNDHIPEEENQISP